MRDLNQFAFKKEAVPGTAETLTASNVLVRIRDGDAPDTPMEAVETGEMQDTSSSRPNRIGKQEFRANISWCLRPSATPLSVAPACGPLLEAGLLKEEAVKSIAIGSVTSGPFRDGETITGTTSAATGKVFRPASATPLYYTVLTGTFQSGEVITGGTSGATATSSGAPAAAGFKYQLTDSDFIGGGDSKHHGTAQFLRGGYYYQGRGCLGALSFEFKNNQHAVVKSTLAGALSAHGDKAFYSVASFPDEAVVLPRFVGAQLALDAFSPTDIVDFTLSIPLNAELREDANDAIGIRFADYDRRTAPPTVTFEPALVAAATYDFLQKYMDGTTFALKWQLGTSFFFFADECQFTSLGVGSRRALATIPIQVRLCGKKNNEIQMWAK